MLEFMRRKARSPIIQAMVLIIILVFVFWGMSTNQGGSGEVAATVNDQTISIREYQQSYNQLTNLYRDQFGGQLPPGLFETLGIREMALEQLIEQKLIRQGAREMGLEVSPDEIQRTIQEMEVFRTEKGFDLNRYREVLSASRMPASDFEASIREDLLMRKVKSLLDDFARVSEHEVEERFQYEFEELNLEYLAISADEFIDRVEVNEEQLNEFFAKNKSRYQTPPQLKLQYLTFPLAPPSGAPEITIEELKNYYQQNLEQYRVNERRQARHILIRTSESDSPAELAAKREQLEAILAQIRAGGDFSAMARLHSQDGSAGNGGDLGFFERGQMVPPFEEAAFNLQPGEISEVVATTFGFHLIKMERVEPAHTKSLEEVREEIAAALRSREMGTEAFVRANTAYERIMLSGSLKKYSEQAGIPLGETGYFTRQNPPAALAGDQAYLEAAFALQAGELSSLITGAQGYAIFFVEDIKAPEIQPLATVRAQVEKDYLAERATELAREAAQAVLASARQGDDLAMRARELGASLQATGFVSRRQPKAPGVPIQVLQEGLTLSEARPYPAEVMENGRTFYVIRFKEKRPPTGELSSQAPELRQLLLQEEQQALLDGWLDSLRKQAKITRNERLLSQQ